MYIASKNRGGKNHTPRILNNLTSMKTCLYLENKPMRPETNFYIQNCDIMNEYCFID